MEITPIIQRKFLSIQDEMPVSKMIGKLVKENKRFSLVFKNDKYQGIIENKKLLRSKLDTTATKVKNYLQKAPLINEHADIIETAYTMYQSNVDCAPVKSGNEIAGLLCALDLVTFASQIPETAGFKVSNVKLVKRIKVNKNEPIATAIELMYKHRVDRVPVFERGKLYGIISFQDLLKNYLNWIPQKLSSAQTRKVMSTKSAQVDKNRWSSLPVSSFSTNTNLVTIKSSASLLEAAKLMEKYQIHSLIVMDKEEMEGVLTVKNMLRKIGSLKIPKNFNIRFVGLKDLELGSQEKYNLRKITSNEAFKLQRMLKNEFSLTLHIKEYQKEGKQHKYSVTLRIEFPGQMIKVAQEDWAIEAALHKTFNNAKNKVKKQFHGDASHQKYY